MSMEYGLCPGNPGLLVASYKSSDEVHKEMNLDDLDDPDEEVSVGNYARIRIYGPLYIILMEVWRSQR